MNERRAQELRDAGLESVQISFQSDEATLADFVAGASAHEAKLGAARIIRETGLAFSMNVVLHRANISRLDRLIALAESLGAERLELANVQYYGWGFRNRAGLLPTRDQVAAAAGIAQAEKQRLAGRMEIYYVLPDLYETRPKPCMRGWGRRYLTVNPAGEVLPCPTAAGIPGMRFDNVKDRDLEWIWNRSESFNRFRGTEMNTGAMPGVPAQGDRLWRMPLPGGTTYGGCRRNRPGMYAFTQQSHRGRSPGGNRRRCTSHVDQAGECGILMDHVQCASRVKAFTEERSGNKGPAPLDAEPKAGQ